VLPHPRDRSLIGVDDIPFSAVSIPVLTTMRVSRSSPVVPAVEVLRTRLKNIMAVRAAANRGYLVERKSFATSRRPE
jgi:DNA-binding LacI/PurR family transcriptional regulator